MRQLRISCPTQDTALEGGGPMIGVVADDITGAYDIGSMFVKVRCFGSRVFI